ncbi:MAG: phosphoglycerate dehydrogenase [Bacteroidia bacterium]|nr:phosphoglycerate dehydrogenase [Bacteroidia bacterium]
MESSIHILIVDDVHPALLDALETEGLKYDYRPDIMASDVKQVLSDFNVLIVRSKIQADREMLEANPQLELIMRAGSGMDNIDLEVADKLKISCVNTPEANCDAVGEQTVGMLLNLAHNINKGSNEIALGIWDREGNRGFEIGTRTVGIIGYGNTGSAVARKLEGFGCEILAYDKYKEGFGNGVVQEVDLNRLLEEADVISFHVPLTHETRSWINTDFIDSVRKPFVLLNLSRGGIMKTSDVVDGLKKGKISGFASDVLENEKLTSLSQIQIEELNTLNEMNNVVLTPHVGGWTQESYRKISEVLVKKLLAWRHIMNKGKNANRRNTQFVG